MTLETILEATRKESVTRQQKQSLTTLQREVKKMSPTRGFARALRAQPFGLIAEIKRQSPSMGSLGLTDVQIDAVIAAYHQHNVVAAISVLTQECHFGGSMKDLERVRNKTQCRPKPILRKDFIESEYEVYYSRWIGADAILLMANVVTDKARFKALHDLANELGLDVLCEIHDQAEIALLPDSAKICGINSRKFRGVSQKKAFSLREKLFLGGPNRDTQTDLGVFSIFNQLPGDCLKVAESGMSADTIGGVLSQYPFNAALVGTSLLKSGLNTLEAHLDKMQSEAQKALPARSQQPATSGHVVYAA